MAKALLLPLWMPFCLAVNLLALAADRLDRTGAFYSNVLLVFRKPAPGKNNRSAPRPADS